jgi:hypothetical protein
MDDTVIAKHQVPDADDEHREQKHVGLEPEQTLPPTHSLCQCVYADPAKTLPTRHSAKSVHRRFVHSTAQIWRYYTLAWVTQCTNVMWLDLGSSSLSDNPFLSEIGEVSITGGYRQVEGERRDRPRILTDAEIFLTNGKRSQGEYESTSHHNEA